MSDESAENSEWQKFLRYPFSARTRSFFANANIMSVRQLAAMSQQDLLRYRGVGRKTLTELRIALANHASPRSTAAGCLVDATSSDAVSKTKEIEMLLEEQTKLEAQLRKVKEKLLEAKASIPRKPKIKPLVFARWLELRDYHAVAKDFSLTPSKVSSIVSEVYRQKLKTKNLDKVDIFCRWKETRNYEQVAKELDVPEFLVKNIVVRWNKRA
jgi:RNA polymerase alpha subunit